MKDAELDQVLQATLEEGYYTLEDLERRTGVPKAEIHRAFHRLCKKPGWSIRPVSSGIPYARFHRMGRNRPKGKPYIHDTAEPDWTRTYFKVRRPENDT